MRREGLRAGVNGAGVVPSRPFLAVPEWVPGNAAGMPLQDAFASGGEFGCQFEGADAHQMLVVMTPRKMALALEVHVACGGRAVAARPRFEQRPRGLVAGRDGGVDVAHAGTGGALHNGVEHASAETLAARFLRNGYLPHEPGVGLSRWNVGGNEPHQAFIALCVAARGGN